MRTLRSCKIANWFAFYQLGFLTLYSLIWIICFRNFLGHNRIIAINTLPRMNNGNLYFISLVTIRFWGGFWGRGAQWRSCVKDLFSKGNSAGWQYWFTFHRLWMKIISTFTHTSNIDQTQDTFSKPFTVKLTKPWIILNQKITLWKLCCCVARRKPIRREKTKPQTEMVISLWFCSLLAHP